jgi:DNA-binding GntR family transcriptional regulator
MRSPATEIAQLCDRGLTALEAGRFDEIEDLAARMEAVGQPEHAGKPEDLRQALEATRRFHDAVATAARKTVQDLTRLREGRLAMSSYESRAQKDPRAVDMSA